MPYCPSCGKEVLASDFFCWSCGNQLPWAGQQWRAPGRGVSVATGRPAATKNAWLGVFLSFILPGLGQYYMDEKKKGKLFMLVAFVLALLILVEVGVYLYTIFWLYNMFDAFLVARKAVGATSPIRATTAEAVSAQPF